MCSWKFSLSSIKTPRYLALLTTLIDPAAQLRFISTGGEWSFGFIIIALDLATFSSVPRGGGGAGGLEPPHWLVKYAKSHVYGAFEADFLWKIENSPPQTFEFPNLAEKSVSISVKTFFFLETTWFWSDKTFEFPSFPRNFVSIFEQTVWNWYKNNENSGQGRLHFSHSFKIAPPPLFQILATRLATFNVSLLATIQSLIFSSS